ncbi:MAG: hypothetical protein VX589_10165 [Myxococcota bacterium]|nr:hypothetical protein [Myxococcota bacterium]
MSTRESGKVQSSHGPCAICPKALNEDTHGESPFRHASLSCVTAILRLCFERDDVIACLKMFDQEPEVTGLRIGALYRRFALVVRQSGTVGRSMRQTLWSRFGHREASHEPCLCPMLDVADQWARARDARDGFLVVALLLNVALASAPCFRRLETIMLDDLNYMASRSLMVQSDCRPIQASDGLSVGWPMGTPA